MESTCRNSCIVILLWILPLFAASQYREVFTVRQWDSPILVKSPILFRAFPLYQDNALFSVYFLVELQYDYMQFFEEGDHYRARVQLEITLHQKNSTATFNKVWSTTTTTSSFDSTNLKTAYHFTADSLKVPPGNYTINFIYRDLNSGRSHKFTTQLIIKPQKGLFYPLPLFCYPDVPPTTAVALCPKNQPSALSSHWDFNRDARWILHVGGLDTTTTLQATIVFRDQQSQTVALRMDTTLQFQPTTHSVSMFLPLHQLPEGQYDGFTTLKANGREIHFTVPLAIVWFTKPRSLWSLKTALLPLKYIMDDSSFKNLQEGNQEAQKRKFQAFWKARDPDPQTPYNPVQEEFYRRVDEANRRWSTRHTPGWETDRGRIYILYGEPDEIEDRSLAPEPPQYLKWIYYRDGKRIITLFEPLEVRKIMKLKTLYTE